MVRAVERAPGAGLYIIQDVCELGVPADARRLREAWDRVAARHSALRTRIETASDGELGKTVVSEPDYEWSEEDWSGLAEEQLPNALERFLERDRERGFGWSEGVPMRFAVLRTPAQKSIVIWSVHHVLLDGRSMTAVWREWLAAYDGLPLPAISEDGLRGDDAPAEGAEEYWREHLKETGQRTSFITDRLFPGCAASPSGAGRAKVELSEEETARAHEYARRHGFTAHTLVQGAWALLLSRYSGSNDVVFGVTRSLARFARGAAGMHIHTLPLRVSADTSAPVVQWLQQLRAQWQTQRAFETTPLDQACRWGGRNGGAAPFDSILIYEHARPIDTLRQMDASWKARGLTRVQRTDSPVTVAAFGAPELSVELIYDRRLFCPETIRPLAAHLLELLRGLIAQPDVKVAALSMLTPEERRWLVDEIHHTGAPLLPDLRAQHFFEEQAALAPGRTAIEWDSAAFFALPPELPGERLAAMLETSRARLVIAQGVRREWFAARGCTVLDAGTEWEERADSPPMRAGFDDAAYAVFTSGSTGRPKAVVLTHRGLVNYITGAASAFGIGDSDRRLQFAPIGTDVFIGETCCCLSRGAVLVIYPPEADRTLGEYLRRLREARITITSIASSWASEWAASIEHGVELPPQLRAVVVGMERVQPAAFETWRRIAKGRLRWFNAYGPSETSVVATIYEAGTSVWEESGHVPIGATLPNVRAYVLDEAGALVPAGLIGELYVGGEGVGRGYLGASEKDVSRFRDDPFAPGGKRRMYRTGDLVYRLPDGNLVFVGRADRQVKLRGFRIELEEIEAALASHPGIRHCAVVLTGTEGRQKIAAYVEAAPGTPSSPSDWRAHLERRLPAHMLPAGFVVLPKMPATPSGKIDRRSLPPFEPARENPATASVPATDLERLLVDLWRDALDTTRVEPGDDFFERGGDSLAATRLIVAIEKHLGLQLPLAALMRAPTPARMAALLDDPAYGKPGALQAGGPFLTLKSSGSRPPLICITTTAAGPHCLERLALRLAPEQPLLVLPAIDPEPDRAGTVDRLAAHVREALRSAAQKGPYLLGGYCLGGVVAFTVARQLCAEGEEVRLVALFDAAAPGYPRVLQSGRGYLRQAGEWLRGRASFSASDVTQHVRMMTKMARKRPVLRPAPEVAQFPIVQFIARQEPITTRVWEDPRLGWRDLCASASFVEVAAGHENIFAGEAMDEIAARLEEHLLCACASRAAEAR